MLCLGPDISLKYILANYVTLIFANKTSLSVVKRLGVSKVVADHESESSGE